MAITQTTAAAFIPELWAPVGGTAQSQYVIRELSDCVVIWRPRSSVVRRRPLPYVAALVRDVVEVQSDPEARRETRALLHAVLDSPVARLAAQGIDIVFDRLYDLKERLTWDDRRMRLWRIKEERWGEFVLARDRFERSAWDATPDEEGC